MSADRSKVIKHREGGWDGVDVGAYKDPDVRHRGMSRRVLVGDAADEQAASTVTRYFEVEAGGYSTLERHEHSHTVVVLKGSGSVILGDEIHALAPLDCIYVAPGTLHQFQADADTPLAFLCLVDRERDRGVPATEQDRERLAAKGIAAKPA